MPTQQPVQRPPDLRGQSVTLRPYAAGFDEAELRALYRWSRDQGIVQLSGGRTLDVTFERFRELFEDQLHRHNTSHEQLFAVLDAAGRIIGRAGLFAIDPRKGRAELGIVIGDRDAWGMGYGRDTVRTLSAFGLDVLGLDRIVLYTYPENERAQRAFAAVGFRPVRRVRRFSFDRGSHAELEMVLNGKSGSEFKAR